MNELVSTISGPVLLGVFAAVGGIIFLTVWQVLRENGLFGRRIAAVVALCVSLLCLVGVYQWLFAKGGHRNTNDSSETNLNLLLLPYAALAVALITVLLFMFFRKAFQDRGLKRSVRESKRKQKLIHTSEPRLKDGYLQPGNRRKLFNPFGDKPNEDK